jgi:hypothetical protein
VLTQQLIFIPVLNPDGYAFTRAPDGGICSSYMTQLGQCDRLWRKNRRPATRSEASDVQQCVGTDLNRNWVRGGANHPSHVLHPLALMTRRAVQALDWGVRGGESTSAHPCSVTYSGPTAFSEMETQAVRTMMQFEPIHALLDLHTYKQLVLAPWSHSSTPPPHAAQLDVIVRSSFSYLLQGQAGANTRC